MNRLAGETSPYLLQHASNPVDWQPWGDEALREARERDVPVLLSVGYSACHWCHVMEHESFSDPAIAELMNRMFVSVKVDREERPDVDAVYMDAVVGMTGQGGWPMTVFLTPDGQPFYGGTYFPPEPRAGMPSFAQLLTAVATTWRERRGEVTAMAGRVTEAMRRSAERTPSDDAIDEPLLTAAVDALERVYDTGFGGFGRAPKFPPGPVIGFLLREHHRTGAAAALRMAVGTLDGMALGGMYDVLGGGFHRYSVDGAWLVPHFEKMLYDNALLAVAYLEGWAVTGEPRYRRVAAATLDYLVRELRTPEGGFASSQDADTEGIEGATFVWTPDELVRVLGEADGAAAAEYYGVTADGTFEGGASVLRPSGEPPPGSERWATALIEARAARAQPGRDDKVLASWNGLALAALAQGGWRLGRPDLLEVAGELARFLTADMADGSGGLLRTSRGGVARIPGYLEDYASVSHGLLELHVAGGDPAHLAAADRLAGEAVRRFGDSERGGFFFAAADAERLVVARKELDDNPTPSGSSLLATVLLRLARLHGDAERERLALGAIRLALPEVRRAPHGFGQLLQAIGLHLAPSREVAVVGDPADPATGALVDAVRDGFHPTVVYAFGSGSGPSPVPLLEGREPVDGRPAAYVCERFACRLPLTDAAAAREAMAA